MYKIHANIILGKIKTIMIIISNLLYENWNYSVCIIINKGIGVKVKQV